MTKVGEPRHDPVPIGEAATPPFAVLPQPESLFSRRAERFAALAQDHLLGDYLRLLAGLSEAQHRACEGLPEPDRPSAETLALAREHAMPPLDRHRFTSDQAFYATLDRLLQLCATLDMPDAARAALAQVLAAEPALRVDMARCVLDEAAALDGLGEQFFVAAALQVHFARLAAGLDPARLVPVGDGACPACGGAPVSSLVVGWPSAHGTRFCACALCGTLWNYVRIKCTRCGSTKSIAYQEVTGGPGTVKAETCDSCRSYVKILHQHKDPALDPIADDVASLALDLLVREAGYRRGSVNPFLAGY